MLCGLLRLSGGAGGAGMGEGEAGPTRLLRLGPGGRSSLRAAAGGPRAWPVWWRAGRAEQRSAAGGGRIRVRPSESLAGWGGRS
eukprot:2481964-Rhodomonas_salina.1